jgi:imidazolonepropionase-like amidohydrolase
MKSEQCPKTRRTAFCTGVYLIMSSICFVQNAPASDSDFVVRNVRIFDGKVVLPNGDVWVEAGKIKALGKRLKAHDGIKEFDGTGKTLLPGFIDSHTHAWGDALKKALIFGVTTELDMLTQINFAQQVKREQAAGKSLDVADLRSAGTPATVPSGHGTQYGFPIPTLSTPDDAPAWVRARILEGSDYIKVIYDDASAYGLHRPTLNKETMQAVIDAAHAQEKLAVAHIGGQQEAREAIEAGVDGLVHLFTDGPPTSDFAAFIAQHKAFVVPTLTVLEGVGGSPSGESLTIDARLTPFLSPADIANLKKTLPKFPAKLSEKYAEQTVRDLVAAHVPVLAGTDAPNPGTLHGASIHRELELLVRSGMTPIEALAAATSVPAAVFHLEDRGAIVVGKRADLVLVKGDPTKDITVTRAIVAVWKLGVQADRDGYAAQIKQETLAYERAKQTAPPIGSEPGLISDFDDGKPSAKFGAGWSVSTDSIAGGKSTSEMKLIDGASCRGKHSLNVSGDIASGLPFAWGGVMFSPGAQTFAPANLSSKKELSFWAKGDGQSYRVLIFTESGGRIPAQQMFVASKDWKQHTFAVSDFNGTDGQDLTAILFVGGPVAGKFDFQIDDLWLK